MTIICVRRVRAIGFGAGDLQEWSMINTQYCGVIVTPLRRRYKTLGGGLLTKQ